MKAVNAMAADSEVNTLRPWGDLKTVGEVRVCVVCDTPKIWARFDPGSGRCVMCRLIFDRVRFHLRSRNVPSVGATDRIRRFYAQNGCPPESVTWASTRVAHFHHWEWPPTGDSWTSRGLCIHLTRHDAEPCPYDGVPFTFLGACTQSCLGADYGEPPAAFVAVCQHFDSLSAEGV